MHDLDFKFTVRDEGNGISEENQKKLFQMFANEDMLRNAGIGLGLTISKKLC